MKLKRNKRAGMDFNVAFDEAEAEKVDAALDEVLATPATTVVPPLIDTPPLPTQFYTDVKNACERDGDIIKVVEEATPMILITPAARVWALAEAQHRVVSMEYDRGEKFKLDEFYDNVTNIAAWIVGEETAVDQFLAGLSAE